MITSIVLAVLLITGCVTPSKIPVANVDRIMGIAVGTDKAEVLRSFGAPQLIEIEAQRFRYTYVTTPGSKVTIIFDEKNKVAQITK